MTKEEKAIYDLKDLFFKQLDAIYDVCENSAKQFESKSIPLNLLKICIDKTKTGFNKGLKIELKK